MRVIKEDVIGIVIDVQERLIFHMNEYETLISKLTTLIDGMLILDIDMILSEQYKKGLGLTIEPVRNLMTDHKTIEKTSFSCCDNAELEKLIISSNKRMVILAGVEAHICIQQTAIDLLDRGYIPIVIEDCVSSRYLNDKMIAIKRMREEGAIITTMESVLFELCRYSGTQTFKKISKMLK